MNLHPSHIHRAELFKNLHTQNELFIVPNPWDAGSARILQSMGFKALATTSAGLAFALGKPDGQGLITREQAIKNALDILDATDLPVAADLENGYGDDPGSCAETITLAAAAGLSGGSIEDATGNPDDPIYPFDLAVRRVKAAAEAVRNFTTPFTLTARAENLINGKNDLPDTIKRLQAYADAGADVLFAPGLKTKQDVETVVRAVSPKPVNMLMGISGSDLSLAMLEQLGVKRVSLGSSLSRAAFGALFRAAREILDHGTVDFTSETIPYAELNGLFGQNA